MKRLGWCFVIALAALGPARGADPPAEEKKDPTPKEKFQALVKDFTKQQSDLMAEIRKTKGDEQQKHIQKYMGLGKDFGDKFYQLAEDHPKDPVAMDAVFWIVQNAQGSPAFGKASDKVVTIVADMPLADLLGKLRTMRMPTPAIVAAAVKRAEASEPSTELGDLLAWAATSGGMTPAGQKAVSMLVAKYPEHRAIEQICATLSRRFSDKNVESLRQILDKSTNDNIKAAATLGLGRCLASRVDSLGDDIPMADKVAAEAEKYFQQVVDEFGEKFASKKKEAEREIKMLQTLRVGKVAPEITGPDLDGKEFKLSDYRGKVVLLDFWGHW